MPEPNKGAPAAPKKNNFLVKVAAVTLFLFFLLFLGIYLYVHSLSNSAAAAAASAGPPPVYAIPGISVRMASQEILSSDYNTSLIPYALFAYSASNVSSMHVDFRYLASSPPSAVYVLNWTNQCHACSNVTQMIGSLTANLINYGVIDSAGAVHIVSQQQVAQIPSGTVLVVLNGLLPDYLLNKYSGNQTLLGHLLNKNITIVYIGQDFSHIISSQSLVLPNSDYGGGVLLTSACSYSGSYATSGFYFNRSTFAFGGCGSASASYGPATFENLDGGTIISFSNYLSSWPTAADAGYDVAKALYGAFWIRNYTSSELLINTTPSNSMSGYIPTFSSPFGVGLGSHYKNVTAMLNGSYARAAIVATSPTGNAVYTTVMYRPKLSIGGFISMPTNVTPGYPFNITSKIFVGSAVQVEPHLNIFNSSMVLVESLPPPFSKQVSPPSYSFIQNIDLRLPQGRYIAQMAGFSNENYGFSAFTVPNLTISLVGYPNSTSNTYLFSVLDSGNRITGFNATVSVNGQYRQNVTVANGTIRYELPTGALQGATHLSFSVAVLGQNTGFAIAQAPVSFTINKQYIEFIFALVIVIVEITVIKAPARDDFYVDVASMPRPQALSIKLKYTDMLGVFDKLNLYYHWRFMPLSKSEFRTAVFSNVHYNSMPVMLTYKNIDVILDSLVSKGYLVSMDDLYAPAAWMEQSRHDIEYLATFKKIRVSLVGHGHIFTDLDKSDAADIVTTLHDERAYIVINSKTSKFQKVPVYANSKTYLAFLNSDRLEDFTKRLYSSSSRQAEELKIYISVGSVTLIDADAPEGILT